jgi:hypothetical protein
MISIAELMLLALLTGSVAIIAMLLLAIWDD